MRKWQSKRKCKEVDLEKMTIHPNLYIQVHHSKNFTQPPVVPNFNSVHWLFLDALASLDFKL